MSSQPPSKGSPICLFQKVKENLLVPRGVARRPELSAVAKLVFGRLRAYAGRNMSAFPKISTLAAELAVSRDTIERALKNLRDHGLIEVEHHCHEGRPSEYFFLDHPWLHDTTSSVPTPKKRKRMSSTRPPLVLVAGQAPPCLDAKTSPAAAAVGGDSPRTDAAPPPPVVAAAEEGHVEEGHVSRGGESPCPNAARSAGRPTPTKSPSERHARPQRTTRHDPTPSSAGPLPAPADHPVVRAWAEFDSEMVLTDEEVARLVADWGGDVELAAAWVRWVLSPEVLPRLIRALRRPPGWRPTSAWVSRLAQPDMSYRGEFLHDLGLMQMAEATGLSSDIELARFIAPIIEAHAELTGTAHQWPVEAARLLEGALKRMVEEREVSPQTMCCCVDEMDLPRTVTPPVLAEFIKTLVSSLLDDETDVEDAIEVARAVALPDRAKRGRTTKSGNRRRSTHRRRKHA